MTSGLSRDIVVSGDATGKLALKPVILLKKIWGGYRRTTHHKSIVSTTALAASEPVGGGGNGVTGVSDPESPQKKKGAPPYLRLGLRSRYAKKNKTPPKSCFRVKLIGLFVLG